MRRGSRVTVYSDPITQTKPEGIATVVKLIMSDDGFAGDGIRYTYAEVRFDDDPEVYDRWIQDAKA